MCRQLPELPARILSTQRHRHLLLPEVEVAAAKLLEPTTHHFPNMASMNSDVATNDNIATSTLNALPINIEMKCTESYP